MKICIECGRELFDNDESCDRCNSNNIINEKEYKNIIEEIKNANILKRRKLLQDSNYKKIYDRIQQPKNHTSKPVILQNKQTAESKEEYWERINIHTINKSNKTKSTVECPYCHSINTKKITNSSKAVHTALFGVFSLSRNCKQFHCNNCKADFQVIKSTTFTK